VPSPGRHFREEGCQAEPAIDLVHLRQYKFASTCGRADPFQGDSTAFEIIA
jgi:hypothetical protein